MLKRLLASTAVVSLAPLIAAAATVTTNWVVYGADHGSGFITLGAADNGGYDILSFTGVIDGAAVTLLGGQPGWEPGPANAGTPPGVFTAPAFSTFGLSYDNIYYPGVSPNIPCFGPASGFSNQNADAYGILFNYNGGEGEIWGNGTQYPYIFGTPGLYTFEVATGIATPADYSTHPYTPQTPVVSYYSGNVGFQVGVPEPSTWAILLVGFGLAGAAVRRRQTLVRR